MLRPSLPLLLRSFLQTFTFTHGTLTASIRTILIDGNPWFVAADVCKALGYAEDTGGGFGNTVRPLNDNEKSTLHKAKSHSSDQWLPLFIGSAARIRLISEAGLYKLVMRSDKPQAHTAIVTRPFEHMTFQFREDGWLNMTKAAKNYRKQIGDFMRRPETIAFIREHAKLKSMGNSQTFFIDSKGRLSIDAAKSTGLIETVLGRNGGTWCHPDLVDFYAMWLDPKFAVFCMAVIKDLRTGKAELVITKPEESAVMALPTDYLSALEALVVAERERVRLAAADYRNAPLTAPVRF